MEKARARSGISTHKWVDENLTNTLLMHFKEKENILKDCVREIVRLDEAIVTCKEDQCEYSNECERTIITRENVK